MESLIRLCCWWRSCAGVLRADPERKWATWICPPQFYHNCAGRDASISVGCSAHGYLSRTKGNHWWSACDWRLCDHTRSRFSVCGSPNDMFDYWQNVCDYRLCNSVSECSWSSSHRNSQHRHGHPTSGKPPQLLTCANQMHFLFVCRLLSAHTVCTERIAFANKACELACSFRNQRWKDKTPEGRQGVSTQVFERHVLTSDKTKISNFNYDELDAWVQISYSKTGLVNFTS